MNNTKVLAVFGAVSFAVAVVLAGVLISCQALAKGSSDAGTLTEVSAGVSKEEPRAQAQARELPTEPEEQNTADEMQQAQDSESGQEPESTPESEPEPTPEEQGRQRQQELDEQRASLGIVEDYRAGFVHGEKPAEFQKYIVLHDTEGEGDGLSVVQSWDAAGNGVAAHFVVNKDGSIVQCVPLDKIAHHAGFGNVGHNAHFGVEDESRDDKVGTTSIGSDYPDYGMNSWSVGIEMVHVGGTGTYPEEQLAAVDRLIAYIDAYFGFESQIIDHKTWRTTNSDTSAEFAGYLANYQAHRTHNGG